MSREAEQLTARLLEADFQLLHAEQRLRQLEHEALLRQDRDGAHAAEVSSLQRQLDAAQVETDERCKRLEDDAEQWKLECRDSQHMVSKLRSLLQELRGEYRILQHQHQRVQIPKGSPGQNYLSRLQDELKDSKEEAERALNAERRQSAYWRAAAEEQEGLRKEMEGAIRGEIEAAALAAREGPSVAELQAELEALQCNAVEEAARHDEMLEAAARAAQEECAAAVRDAETVLSSRHAKELEDLADTAAAAAAVSEESATRERAAYESALSALKCRLEESEREWQCHKREVADRHEMLADAAERAARELSASVEELQSELEIERESHAATKRQNSADLEGCKDECKRQIEQRDAACAATVALCKVDCASQVADAQSETVQTERRYERDLEASRVNWEVRERALAKAQARDIHTIQRLQRQLVASEAAARAAVAANDAAIFEVRSACAKEVAAVRQERDDAAAHYQKEVSRLREDKAKAFTEWLKEYKEQQASHECELSRKGSQHESDLERLRTDYDEQLRRQLCDLRQEHNEVIRLRDEDSKRALTKHLSDTALETHAKMAEVARSFEEEHEIKLDKIRSIYDARIHDATAEFNLKIDNLTTERDRMAQKISGTTKLNADLRSELSELYSRCEGLKTALEAARTEATNVRAAATQAAKAKASLHADALAMAEADADSRLVAVREEAVVATAKAVEAFQGEAKSTIAALEAEHAAKIDELKQKLHDDALSDKNAAIDELQNSFAREIEELKDEAKASRATVEVLTTQHAAEIHHARTASDANLQKLMADNDAVLALRDAQEAVLKDQKSSVLEEHLAAVGKLNASHASEIERLKSEIAEEKRRGRETLDAAAKARDESAQTVRAACEASIQMAHEAASAAAERARLALESANEAHSEAVAALKASHNEEKIRLRQDFNAEVARRLQEAEQHHTATQDIVAKGVETKINNVRAALEEIIASKERKICELRRQLDDVASIESATRQQIEAKESQHAKELAFLRMAAATEREQWTSKLDAVEKKLLIMRQQRDAALRGPAHGENDGSPRRRSGGVDGNNNSVGGSEGEKRASDGANGADLAGTNEVALALEAERNASEELRVALQHSQLATTKATERALLLEAEIAKLTEEARALEDELAQARANAAELSASHAEERAQLHAHAEVGHERATRAAEKQQRAQTNAQVCASAVQSMTAQIERLQAELKASVKARECTERDALASVKQVNSLRRRCSEAEKQVRRLTPAAAGARKTKKSLLLYFAVMLVAFCVTILIMSAGFATIDKPT